MVKIEFGAPFLMGARRYIEYELRGIAFIEGYEKPIGFNFECHPRFLRLSMKEYYHAKHLYKFFRELFENVATHEGLWGERGELHAEWSYSDEKINEILDRIERAMGLEWKEAFRKIFSVHYKV